MRLRGTFKTVAGGQKFPVLLQIVSQLGPAPAEAGFHRAERHVCGLGYLVVAQPLNVGKDKDEALIGVK